MRNAQAIFDNLHDGDITGAVRCTVEAENLTKPVELLIPVSRKVEAYSPWRSQVIWSNAAMRLLAQGRDRDALEQWVVPDQLPTATMCV